MFSNVHLGQLGSQAGTRKPFNPTDEVSDKMLQRQLPMLARLSAPSVVHPDSINNCRTYRDAVRLCFALRRVRRMCARSVAEHAGIHPPHITDFLSDKDGRREMPAKYIQGFEDICGNTAITQWLAKQAALTINEESGFGSLDPLHKAA